MEAQPEAARPKRVDKGAGYPYCAKCGKRGDWVWFEVQIWFCRECKAALEEDYHRKTKYNL